MDIIDAGYMRNFWLFNDMTCFGTTSNVAVKNFVVKSVLRLRAIPGWVTHMEVSQKNKFVHMWIKQKILCHGNIMYYN